MICSVITGPTLIQAHKQLKQVQTELIELRLDLFEEKPLEVLKSVQKVTSCALVVTLRSQQQGGQYRGTEEERYKQLFQLAACLPDYLDIESHVSPDIIQEIAQRYPSVKIIVSSHDFEATPDDLDGLFQSMQRTGANLYKIALMANSVVDAMRFLAWAKDKTESLIAISMGEYGQVSRIIGPVLGSPITYACLEGEVAPGQLSVQELLHYSLKKGNAIYGLIGDPVTKSISHITHNQLLGTLGGVYVKMPVRREELKEFLYWAQKIGFCGLSVTMPLKEAVVQYVDILDPDAEAIGAVNTLHFKDGQIFGYNTDGKGALEAIEQTGPVAGKQVVILGAGGAARAIAYEAIRRGADVTILNRDEKKAEAIAARFGCRGGPLDTPGEYDLLINCTPLKMPCNEEALLPGRVVMDITTLPKETPLIAAAKQKGCRVIYGWQMFVQQALGQFSLWMMDDRC